MTKFPFVENAWTIYRVAKAQGVDIGVAFDMVKADVRNGVNYNTKLENVDFAVLNEQWDVLDGDVQNDAIDSWSEFYTKNFKELTAAWLAKDKKAFQEIVDKA